MATLSAVIVMIIVAFWLYWCKNKKISPCFRGDQTFTENQDKLFKETTQNIPDIKSTSCEHAYEVIESSHKVTVDNVLYSYNKSSPNEESEDVQIVYNSHYKTQDAA